MVTFFEFHSIDGLHVPDIVLRFLAVLHLLLSAKCLCLYTLPPACSELRCQCLVPLIFCYDISAGAIPQHSMRYCDCML